MMSNPFDFSDVFKNMCPPMPKSNEKEKWQIIIRCPFCAQKIGLHGKTITDKELIDCPKCKKEVEISIRIKG